MMVICHLLWFEKPAQAGYSRAAMRQLCLHRKRQRCTDIKMVSNLRLRSISLVGRNCETKAVDVLFLPFRGFHEPCVVNSVSISGFNCQVINKLSQEPAI